MGFYDDRVLPRVIDLVLSLPAQERARARAVEGLAGTVVELGFGSGRTLGHYPPTVERVLAVDPSDEGFRLARRRIEATAIPVERVGLDGASLALADGSVDAVVSTWTLCTIPDVEAALAEVRRVLCPGGVMRFVEHGRAAEPVVAARQARLDPWWGRIAGGCHLSRPIDELIQAAGLALTRLDRDELFPATFSSLYEGEARRPI